jgi:hypothetical protein
MTQLAITAIENKNLFSNYYFGNQIKNNPEWKKTEARAVFSEFKNLFKTHKDFIPSLNEKQLQQRFFATIFTISLDHRAARMEQAKAQYSAFVGALGTEDLDRINKMDRINLTTNPVNPVHPVQTATSISAAPDSLKILEFISARLSAAPEESDVVHDLLAYLA